MNDGLDRIPLFGVLLIIVGPVSGRRGLVSELVLVLAFATVLTLVVDLDRPQGGLITVSQQPMIDLQRSTE
jgi:hypothetical protein